MMAIWKGKINKKYQQFDVVTNNLPPNWVPEIIVFDKMFLINCKPLLSTKTITEYAMLLKNRFFVPHYRNNAKEIHMIFDGPKEQYFNPKMFDQKRRDKGHMPQTVLMNTLHLNTLHNHPQDGGSS